MVTARLAWTMWTALLSAGAVGKVGCSASSSQTASQPAVAAAMRLRVRVEHCALVGFGVTCVAAVYRGDDVARAARLEACVGAGDTLGLWPRLEGLATADAPVVEFDVWATPSPGARYCGAIIVSADEALQITALD